MDENSSIKTEIVPEFAKTIATSGGENLNICIQCGTCSGSCPSGKVTAYRTRMIIRKAMVGLKFEVIDSEDIWLCTTCRTCLDRCPRGIDIVEVIYNLRKMAVSEGKILKTHEIVINNIYKYGFAVPLDEKTEEFREQIGLAKKPPTLVSFPEKLDELKNIMEKTMLNQIIQK